jgi:hypothetical protein
MNFRPEMVLAIRRGKCETRRVVNDNPNSPWYRGGCAYHVTRPSIDRFEKTYAICPGRGKSAVGRLKLTAEPELSVVESITDLGAVHEGFEDRAAFLDYFLKLNPGVSLQTDVWVVRFGVYSWDEKAILAMLREMKEGER